MDAGESSEKNFRGRVKRRIILLLIMTTRVNARRRGIVRVRLSLVLLELRGDRDGFGGTVGQQQARYGKLWHVWDLFHEERVE